MSEKSQLRIEIEALLKRHPHGLNTKQIAERVGAELGQVQGVLGKLRDQCLVRPAGKANAPYIWINQEAKVTEALPNRISKMSGVYIPARDNEVSPKRPGSDQHELYGSRIGNKIFYRDGRVEEV